MSSCKIVDLDEIVKIRAWNFYKKCRKFRQPRKLEDIDLVLDWTGVSFDPEDPEYTRIQWMGETKANDSLCLGSSFSVSFALVSPIHCMRVYSGSSGSNDTPVQSSTKSEESFRRDR
jgi:hypothetical protein